MKIIALIQKAPHNLRLDAASNTLRILKHAPKFEERVRFLEGVVEKLG